MIFGIDHNMRMMLLPMMLLMLRWYAASDDDANDAEDDNAYDHDAEVDFLWLDFLLTMCSQANWIDGNLNNQNSL